MSETRDSALMIKGFLQANKAPQELLVGINHIIKALADNKTADIDITGVEVKPEPLDIRELASNFLSSRNIETFAQPCPPENETGKGDSTAVRPQRENKWVKSSLHPANDLSDIQKAHDGLETNAAIAKRYGVTDQTIVNFLKKHGVYTSRAPRRAAPPTVANEDSAPPEPSGVNVTEREEKAPVITVFHEILPNGNNEPRKLPDFTIEKVNIMGEPLISVPAPKRKTESSASPFLPSNDVRKHEVKMKDAYVGIRAPGQEFEPGDLVDIYDMLARGMKTNEIAVYFSTTKSKLEDFILRHRNVQITKCAPAYNPNVVRLKSGPTRHK